MNLLSLVLKHCTTGIDGETFDPARILWIISVLTFLGLSIFTCWKHGVFDPMSYGTGAGGLLAGGGAGVGFKKGTEPQGGA